jgi:protein TonB
MEDRHRYLIAAILAFLFEALLLYTVSKIPKEEQVEIDKVIKISLIPKEERQIRVKVQKGEREEKKTGATFKKPKIESKRARKEVAEGQERERVGRESGGLKSVSGNLPLSYLEKLKAAIGENIFYPLEALEEGIEGNVIVQFKVDRKGRVKECKRIAGNEILAEAACVAIKSSSIPPIPSSIKNDELVFQLQLTYSLEEPQL